LHAFPTRRSSDLLLLFVEPTIYTIMFGILLTIVVCRLFKVLNMARVALVALLIIMVKPHGTSWVEAPFFRFGTVALGCIIGLLIVVLRSEEHTSELQSRENLVCRLLL